MSCEDIRQHDNKREKKSGNSFHCLIPEIQTVKIKKAANETFPNGTDT